VWGRLREVEVHHVDLALGYRPDDWTTAFSQRLLRELVHQLDARPETTALVLHPTDLDHPLTIGGGPDARQVSGPSAELAAWLAGRSAGETLVFSPAGAPPSPPRWL
jgi:maleylpyruvate isomerase